MSTKQDVETFQGLVKAQAELIRSQEGDIHRLQNLLQRCLAELSEIDETMDGNSGTPQGLWDDLRKALGYPTDES